jgi:hypothetical protein
MGVDPAAEMLWPRNSKVGMEKTNLSKFIVRPLKANAAKNVLSGEDAFPCPEI